MSLHHAATSGVNIVTPARVRRNTRNLTFLALFAAFIAASAVTAAGDGPTHSLMIDDGLRRESLSPDQLLAIARLYQMMLLIGWLTIGSFVTGALIGLMGERRAGLWGAIVSAAFFWGVIGAGGRMPTDLAARLVMIGGGLVMLLAGAVGGWIGWHAALGRGRESEAPASEDRPS
jgi:hypothetical protein